MTYKEIIDVFKQKVQGHFFINDFGYGDISDIMTPDDQQPPYYPYIFLNPISVTSGDRVSTFNFNLICMTQSNDDEQSIIRNQSDCIDNMRDIIARVNNTLIDPLIEVQTNYTFTPFKERFQDDVVGASCNISVTYPTILDACSAPIADPNYCLVAFDFSNGNAPFYNNTYTFGGWGYWKYTEDQYQGDDIEYFEWVCDTRYGYYIGEEKTDLNGKPIYPMMSYFDNGYPDSDSTRLNGYYIWYSQDGTTFECGAQQSQIFYNSGGFAVSYAPTTSDNGWVIPTEGWVKTFDPNDSEDRSGNVYIFKTDCTDPKPSPTAAPIPPPSNTPTPTATPSMTPTPTPSPEDCTLYQTICHKNTPQSPSPLGNYFAWTTGYLTSAPPGNNFNVVCGGNHMMYTGNTEGGNLGIIAKYPGESSTSWRVGYLNSGTLACGNVVNLLPVSDYFMDDITCAGIDYPDVADEPLYFNNGLCPSPTPTPTSSVTPTITPSITPTNTVTPTTTVTPTPTSSPFVPSECINYDVTGNTGSGNYFYLGNAIITNTGLTLTITCTGTTSLYYRNTGGDIYDIISYSELSSDYVNTSNWYAPGGLSCGDTESITNVSVRNTIDYSEYNGYYYPTTGTITGETYPYTLTNIICPSPTPTPSITPTSTVTPTITPTTSVTVTPTITPTSSVTPTLTPSVTATLTPTPTPSPIFYHIEAQNGDLIITQGGDFIDWFPL
jgi:hypothetical protein